MFTVEPVATFKNLSVVSPAFVPHVIPAPVTAQPSTATAASGTPGLQPQNSIDGIRATAAPTADAQAATPIDGIQPAPKSEAKKEAPQHPLDAFKHVFPEQ
jgi:hypothetical protein